MTVFSFNFYQRGLSCVKIDFLSHTVGMDSRIPYSFEVKLLIIFYHQDLKKQEDLRNSLVLQGVTPLLHEAQ